MSAYARAAGLKCVLVSGLLNVIALVRGDLVCMYVRACALSRIYIHNTRNVPLYYR